MRLVSDKNTTLKTPLNNILGYEGNVRLLRCLGHNQYSMSHSELAKRTGLSLPGIHKVVPQLMEKDIIQYTGSGKQQQIKLRSDHALSESIIQLFKSEQAHFDSLLEDLKKQIEKLDKLPKSVWIFGKVAKSSDDYGDALQLAVLGDLRTIEKSGRSAKRRAL